jgi:hypothetical protein
MEINLRKQIFFGFLQFPYLLFIRYYQISGKNSHAVALIWIINFEYDYYIDHNYHNRRALFLMGCCLNVQLTTLDFDNVNGL